MKRAMVAAACFLLLGGVAWGHRLDEYLQAVIVSVDAGRVTGEIRLIPGVSVAAGVIAAIDANGDGVFSADEERSYATKELGDWAMREDGAAVKARLVSSKFPTMEEMKGGTGEIHLEFAVELPAGGGSRSFVMEKKTLEANTVYLVNSLIPRDPGIEITGQRRNQTQSSYELDYVQGGVTARSGWWKWVFGIGLIVVVGLVGWKFVGGGRR